MRPLLSAGLLCLALCTSPVVVHAETPHTTFMGTAVQSVASYVYTTFCTYLSNCPTSSTSLVDAHVRASAYSDVAAVAAVVPHTVPTPPVVPPAVHVVYRDRIVEKPVIKTEGVERPAVMPPAGVSQSYVDTSLASLRSLFESRLSALPAPSPVAPTIVYVPTPGTSNPTGFVDNNTALSQRIDTLTDTRITNPTITGGTGAFAALSSAGGVSVTGGTTTDTLSIGSLTGFLKATGGVVSTALVNLASDVTGVLSVANGGTGASTLTGLVKGNGASAMTAAIAGTDYLTPTGSASGLTNFPTFNQNTTGTASNVTGVVAVANGGTNATAQTTNGINYFDGTKITSGTGLVYSGGNVGVGTTNPQYGKLVVAGAYDGTTSSAGLEINTSTAGGATIESIQRGAANKPITFYASKYDFENGNVGIGTTNPGYKLDVNGEINSSAATPKFVFNHPYHYIQRNGTQNDYFSSGEHIMNGTAGVIARFSAASRTTNIYSGLTVGSSYYGSAPPTDGAIFSGNVGVGVATPSYKLDVETTANDFAARFKSSAASGATVALAHAGSYGIAVDVGSGGVAANYGLDIAKIGTSMFRVTGAGNVGLGTTSPSNILSIGGDTARTIWMERSSVAAATGNALTVQAGGTKSGNTDQNGGDLLLASGTATGTGSSKIQFQTASAQGSTGTTDNTPTTKMTILGNGNVGIGTASPTSTLVVNGTAAIGSTGGDVVIGDVGAPANLVFEENAAIKGQGSGRTLTIGANSDIINVGVNMGVGTTSPATKMQVMGDVRVGTGGTNGCLQNYAGTGIAGTCSSDERLKVITATITDVLPRFHALQLVQFKWNTTAEQLYRNNIEAINTGFIAQDIEKTFPELVHTDDKSFKTVDYTTLSLYAIQGIKELAQQLSTAGTVIIDTLTARSITATDTLCVSDTHGSTCINRAQLDALLQLVPSQPTQSQTPQTHTVPTIEIHGDTTVTIPVGETYTDAGATAYDTEHKPLPLTITVDGITVTDVNIDTATPHTSTITYHATDTRGVQTEATRIITVIPSPTETHSEQMPQ